MPAEIVRRIVRAVQHPARGVECPHCGAHPFQPCTTKSKRRRLPEPHPGRVAAWARTNAVCPACQVTPTVPCHTGGQPLHDGAVHHQRYTEAERTAAVHAAGEGA